MYWTRTSIGEKSASGSDRPPETAVGCPRAMLLAINGNLSWQEREGSGPYRRLLQRETTGGGAYWGGRGLRGRESTGEKVEKKALRPCGANFQMQLQEIG